MNYAGIIVDIGHENVDRLYTYSLPFPAEIGQRVLVPFGKSNRSVEGFILSITDSVPDSSHEIKSALRTLEDYPAFDESQLMLAKWIAQVYHCTLAQSLRLMIPAQLRGMRVSEKKIRCVYIADSSPREYLNSLYTKSGKIRSQAAFDTVSLLMQSESVMAVPDLYQMVPGLSSAIIKRLINDGIISETFRTVYRKPVGISEKKATKPVLTDEQRAALSTILKGMENGDSFLLHGVTGSGKTEVYMSVIEENINRGKAAIVLVPEISLTPQTVQRFTERFGKRVAVLHSRLSAGERFDEWRRIRKGLVDVVVGARSAVFAPIHSVGVIIIDEEHENSYSSEKIPRYNTIDVAQKRCSISGGTLILGSATPSVNTYFKTKLGKYKLIELKNRVNKMPLPTIETVDMRAEFLSGNTGIFSDLLKMRLKSCLDSGKQAVLFLNRRGFSSFVSCRACGYVWKCDDCDVSMTYHKFDGKLKCHYCGAERDTPKLCPKCAKGYIKYSGIGTQQIEEEVKKLFPNTQTVRMDADTTQNKDAHFHLLSEFASGKAQVLIGTQMIAKGLDFPNVTLVGVVSVDAMLAMPDFTNTERAFQLLTQVSGRAGRADMKGNVVLQTNDPKHPIIKFAEDHDYKSFYEYAIKDRLKNMYPPFSIFIRVLFSGDDDIQTANESKRFAKDVYEKICVAMNEQHASLSEILYIYAMPAPIKKIQNKHRHQVIIKIARTKNAKSIIDCVYELADDAGFGNLTAVEVNPTEMV